MSERTAFQTAGIDLHQDSLTIAVLREGEKEPHRVETVPNDPSKIRRFFQRVLKEGSLETCYEASGCGYVLHRALTSWGIPCEVIAPSLIPRKPGDHRKTDKRDAVELAKLYRAGQLTPIRIPTEPEERDRGVVRARECLGREVRRSQQHILKFLQARGHVYRDGNRWTQTFWQWLRALAFGPRDALVLDTHMALVHQKIALADRLDQEIEQIAREDPYREKVARLRCLRGVDTLTALSLVTEIGDIRRFDSARRLMGYLGLTVSEFSSGTSERRGPITKAGNSRCRRLLVEAAWHYRHRPMVGAQLKKRHQGQPVDVIAHAWRAQERLYERFWHFSRENKPPTKTVVAVARELTGFIWALLRGDREVLMAPRP